MVFNHRSKGPLLLLLNIGTTGFFSDAVSRVAAKVCDEFYDTLDESQFSLLSSKNTSVTLGTTSQPSKRRLLNLIIATTNFHQ